MNILFSVNLNHVRQSNLKDLLVFFMNEILNNPCTSSKSLILLRLYIGPRHIDFLCKVTTDCKYHGELFEGSPAVNIGNNCMKRPPTANIREHGVNWPKY